MVVVGRAFAGPFHRLLSWHQGDGGIVLHHRSNIILNLPLDVSLGIPTFSAVAYFLIWRKRKARDVVCAYLSLIPAIPAA